MFGPLTGEVFFKATLLAQKAGLSEIGIDSLLAALDSPFEAAFTPNFPESDSSECCAFTINLDWIPLSVAATKALGPFEDIDEMSPDALRTLLLAAQKNGT
jgi:hypothetical protein